MNALKNIKSTKLELKLKELLDVSLLDDPKPGKTLITQEQIFCAIADI